MKQHNILSIALFVIITPITLPNTTMTRTKSYPVESLFIDRWSPRAMSGEPINEKQLMSLFEAARWAPSSYNNQPWRFIYALRGTPEWDLFFNLMVPFNQSWADNAAALVLVISSNLFNFNKEPSRTHSFDTGAALMNFALQGFLQGLVVHGMEGFDYDKAKQMLHIPDDYTVEALFAVGKPGNKQDLSTELKQREVPSDRKPLSELVFKGSFKKKSP